MTEARFDSGYLVIASKFNSIKLESLIKIVI